MPNWDGGEQKAEGEQFAAEQLTHSVVKGDTLWSIAKKYSTTLEKILQLNPQIKNPSLIRVGQEVRVR